MPGDPNYDPASDPRIMTDQRAKDLKNTGGWDVPYGSQSSKATYGGVLAGDPKDYDKRGNYTKPPPMNTDPFHGANATEETEAWKKYFESAPSSFQNTEFNNTQQQQSRNAQNFMLQQYHALAAGDKNSVAQKQLRQSIDAAKAQALSASAGVRGVSAGAALRGAQNQQQRLGVQGNSDSALLMLQEQAQARQQLLNMYGQQRTGDINAANSSADVFGQNQGLNDAYELFNSAQGYGVHEADRRGLLDKSRANLGLDRDLRSANNAAVSSGLNAASTSTQAFLKMYSDSSNKAPATQTASGRQQIDDAFNG